MFKRSKRRNTQNAAGPSAETDNYLRASQQLQDTTLTPKDLPGWIVQHALDSNLSVDEVQRLWNRFEQLGVTEEGSISSSILNQYPFDSDPFLRQMWKSIPREDDESVSFKAFLGVLKWWQDLDKESKLRAIYKMLNKDNSLDDLSLQQILMTMDSNMEEEEARTTAELLLKHLDKHGKGFIDEEQWIDWTMQMSPQKVDDLIIFHIIPPDLPSLGSNIDTPRGTPVTEEQLILVASRIGEKNWTQLAENLGLTENEISTTQEKFRGRSREQAYQMLLLWKRKKKRKAIVEDLSLALNDSGLGEVQRDLIQTTSAGTLG